MKSLNRTKGKRTQFVIAVLTSFIAGYGFATFFSVTTDTPRKDSRSDDKTIDAAVVPTKLQHGFLENWLRVRDGPAVSCIFEPVALAESEWFHDVTPDPMPNFTLTSAWLKSEAPSAMDAAKDIPPMYESGFDMGGKVNTAQRSYYNQAYLGKTAQTSTWSKDLISKNMQKASNRKPMKYGGDGLKIHDGAIKYKSYIEGKRGIVIGSEDPWVEAIMLHYGAAKILTVEFGEINSETMIPKEFTESFLNGRIDQFDFGITYSSLEHDGLGRYGDVLNPIGDLESMGKLLSIIKPGGLLFIGFPTHDGEDSLVWNAHRIYGKHRLPKLFAGWKLIDVIGKGGGRAYAQHLWILQNANGCN
ncbi:hypothetical protein ACHAWF_015503 [Thalassiosira exigua]